MDPDLGPRVHNKKLMSSAAAPASPSASSEGSARNAAKRAPRSRAWCFTLNNYETFFPGREWDKPQELFSAEYLCYGLEKAPETGTPHLQGYARFKNQVGLSTVKKLCATCHWEISRGSPEQNIEYCSKDGKFFEMGKRPAIASKRGGEATMEKWARTKRLAITGQIDDVDPDHFVQHYRTLQAIRKDYQVKPEDLPAVCGVWIYGEAGVGKSYKARKDYPDAYFKACNKWWDSYQGEDNVIIDDFDKSHDVLGHHLKLWADRYAFPAESKGSCLQIRPKRVIVTSQYAIDDIWPDPETRAALRRRFTQVYMGPRRPHTPGPVFTPVPLTRQIAVNPTQETIIVEDE